MASANDLRCLDIWNCLTFGRSNQKRAEVIDEAFRHVEDDRMTLVEQEVLVAAQITKIKGINTIHMDKITRAGGPRSTKPGVPQMIVDYRSSCKELKKKEAELSSCTSRRVQMQLKHLHDRVDNGKLGKNNNGSLTLLYKMLPSIEVINDQNEEELVQLERMKDVVSSIRDHEKEKDSIALDEDEIDTDDALSEDMAKLSRFAASFHDEEQIELDCAMLGLPLPAIYPSAPSSSGSGITLSTVSLNTASSVYESRSMVQSSSMGKYAHHLDGDIDTH